MHKSQENLPCNSVNQYIEGQKKTYELPIHKSGIELAASIANITSSARLITQENLISIPDIFNYSEFKQQREYLGTCSSQEYLTHLEQFSVMLSGKYKKDLENSIENFLHDFKIYFMKNTFNTCTENPETDEDSEYLMFEDALYNLVEPEIEMQETYDTYVELKDFLISTGVEEKTFREINNFIEIENSNKVITH